MHSFTDQVIKVELVIVTHSHSAMSIDFLAFAGMLDRLAGTNATFKCQHKDEPDLTDAEKRAIAAEVLEKDLGAFLYRFGAYLTSDDLVLFEPHRADYAVNLYLRERFASLSASGRRRTAAAVRNRRLAAVEDMMEEGDYFSELEMKKRDPRLYEEMVGQFMTEDEKLALENQVGTSREDQKLSSILADHFILQQRRQESAVSEEEMQRLDVSDDEDEEEVESRDDGEGEEKPELSEGEKLQLREEFRDVMVERFIAGQDEDFNYGELDANPRYRADAIEEQDAEDAYFDSEMPEDALDG